MNKKEINAMIKSLNQLDIILIEWIDAETDDSGWQSIDTPIGSRVVTAQTIGFYVSHNTRLLRTTSNYDPSNGMCTNREDIPRTNIKGIYRLVTRMSEGE